jgi:RNA polymerase sigma factor (sigma-70 family)
MIAVDHRAFPQIAEKWRKTLGDSLIELIGKFQDRGPSPVEAAIFTETVEDLLKQFKERERQIVSMSLEGYDVREVGAAVGCSESKVSRIFHPCRVARVWE